VHIARMARRFVDRAHRGASRCSAAPRTPARFDPATRSPSTASVPRACISRACISRACISEHAARKALRTVYVLPGRMYGRMYITHGCARSSRLLSPGRPLPRRRPSRAGLLATTTNRPGLPSRGARVWALLRTLPWALWGPRTKRPDAREVPANRAAEKARNTARYQAATELPAPSCVRLRGLTCRAYSMNTAVVAPHERTKFHCRGRAHHP
jgi:hypothetical protein